MAHDGVGGVSMDGLLAKQKAAHLREGAPNAEQRIARLDRAIELLVTHSKPLCEAMRADFGHRSIDQSGLTDIATSLGALKFAKKNLRRWMRAERREVDFPLGLLGAKAELHYQPKGVVGLISPWNFPVSMVFNPLAGIFAAGNRVMIKPSEYTEATSQLTQQLFAEYFEEEIATVITGAGDVGAAFTRLPFDHIIFTGSTGIGRQVMRAAAENLVPVTLELGGKSPAIVGESADLGTAALRIMNGKMLNAGQICTAPDYVLLPEAKVRAFASAAEAAVARMFPSGLKDNDDYTSIINQRHYERLTGYVEDARAKGGEIIEINPQRENFSQQAAHKMPPRLVVNPSDDMAVMTDEIFGPILPVKTYRDIEEAVNYVNARPRPLALYYFGEDIAERDKVLASTTSGGVTVNDVLFNAALEDIPFGGIGPSGMGAYHGREGFLEFSHKKSVMLQTKSELISRLRPPYGAAFRGEVKSRIKR